MRTFKQHFQYIRCQRPSGYFNVVKQEIRTIHLCTLHHIDNLFPISSSPSAQHSAADGPKRLVTEVLSSITSLLVQYPERCGEMAEGPGSWPATSTTNRPSTECKKHGDLFSLTALKSLTQLLTLLVITWEEFKQTQKMLTGCHCSLHFSLWATLKNRW